MFQTAMALAIFSFEPAGTYQDKKQRSAANGILDRFRKILAGTDGGAIEKNALVA